LTGIVALGQILGSTVTQEEICQIPDRSMHFLKQTKNLCACKLTDSFH
jgi:hypothetical protein